jgi:hypothetical protein
MKQRSCLQSSRWGYMLSLGMLLCMSFSSLAASQGVQATGDANVVKQGAGGGTIGVSAKLPPPTVTYPATWTKDQKEFMDAVLQELALIDKGRSATDRYRNLRDRVISDINAGRIIVGPTDEGDVETTTGDDNVNRLTIPPAKIDWINAKGNVDAVNKKKLDASDPRRIKAETNLRQPPLDLALTIVHEYVHMDQDKPSGETVHETPAWKERINQESRLIDEAFTQLENEIYRIQNKGGQLSEEDKKSLQDAKRRLDDLITIHGQTTKNELNGAFDEGRLVKDDFKKEQSQLEDQKNRLSDLTKVLDNVLAGTTVSTGNSSTPGGVDLSGLLPGTTPPDPGGQGGGAKTGGSGQQKPVSLKPTKIYSP